MGNRITKLRNVMRKIIFILLLIPGINSYAQLNFFFGSHRTGTATIPNVTTKAITTVSATAGLAGGTVNYTGGATLTAVGICYNTTGSPTTADATVGVPASLGAFTATLGAGTPLTANTTYHTRAYATNSVGTAYGDEEDFKTATVGGTLPTLSVPPGVYEVKTTTAKLASNVTDQGSSNVTAKGVVWATHINPDLTDNSTNDGSGLGVFASQMTDLTQCGQYYARCYATNSEGTAYTDNFVFYAQCVQNITAISDRKAMNHPASGFYLEDWATSYSAKYGDGWVYTDVDATATTDIFADKNGATKYYAIQRLGMIFDVSTAASDTYIDSVHLYYYVTNIHDGSGVAAYSATNYHYSTISLPESGGPGSNALGYTTSTISTGWKYISLARKYTGTFWFGCYDCGVGKTAYILMEYNHDALEVAPSYGSDEAITIYTYHATLQPYLKVYYRHQ